MQSHICVAFSRKNIYANLLNGSTIQYNTIQYFIPIKGPSRGNNKYTFIIISTVTTIQNGDICF